MPRHHQGLVVLTVQDHFLEQCRTGDIGAFADIHKQRVFADVAGLQTGEPQRVIMFRYFARREGRDSVGNCLDMRRCGAAAAADDVQKNRLRPFGDFLRHGFRGFVVLAEFIRQAGIWVRVDTAIGNIRQLFDMFAQLFGAERAVEAERDRFGMAQ